MELIYVADVTFSTLKASEPLLYQIISAVLLSVTENVWDEPTIVVGSLTGDEFVIDRGTLLTVTAIFSVDIPP